MSVSARSSGRVDLSEDRHPGRSACPMRGLCEDPNFGSIPGRCAQDGCAPFCVAAVARFYRGFAISFLIGRVASSPGPGLVVQAGSPATQQIEKLRWDGLCRVPEFRRLCHWRSNRNRRSLDSCLGHAASISRVGLDAAPAHETYQLQNALLWRPPRVARATKEISIMESVQPQTS